MYKVCEQKNKNIHFGAPVNMESMDSKIVP